MVLNDGRAAAALLAVALVVAPAVASADESGSRSISILPWSGVYLQFEEREQRVVAAYSHSHQHFRTRLELSAPINSDTRQANLFASDRLAAPFSANLFLGYDSSPTFDELAEHYFGSAGSCMAAVADLGLEETGNGPLRAALRPREIRYRRAVLRDALTALTDAWEACSTETDPSACRGDANGGYQRSLAPLLQLLAAQVDAPDAPVLRTRRIQFICSRLLDSQGRAPTSDSSVATCSSDAFLSANQYGRLRRHVGEVLARLGRMLTGQPVLCGRRLQANAEVVESRVWARQHHSIVGAALHGSSEHDPQTIAGLEIGFSYGRVTAFPSTNIAASSDTYDQYQLTVGLGLTQYLYGTDLAGYWNVRGGAQVAQRPDVYEAERCRSLPSMDPMVTGEDCDDVQVLRSAPSLSDSAYVSVAGGIILPTLLDGSRPGLELRYKLDDLGQTEVMRWGALLYISPRIDTGPGEAQTSLDPLITRYGVGFEVTQALEARGAMGDMDAVSVGDAVDFTVFVLAGASL